MTISELARRVERQRFRLAHHLGGDPSRLDDQLARLGQLAPFHPVVLNERSRRLLPEVWPGPPPLELAPVARALLDGEPDRGLLLARTLAQAHPDDGQVHMALGDLQLLAGELDAAETSFRRAMELLGPLPCLMVRYGRCRLQNGALREAWKLAVGALTECPIYGTALSLYAEVARAAGHQLAPVPVPLPLRRVDGQVQLHESLTDAAQAAWSIYLAHPGGGRPPGLRRVRAALKTFEERGGGRERLDGGLEVLPLLASWDRAGLLRPYLWIVGLSEENVSEYRGWILERRDLMRAFWELGPTGRDTNRDRP